MRAHEPPHPQIYSILTEGGYRPKSKAAASHFSLGKVVPIFSAVFLGGQLAKSKEKVMGKVCSVGLQPFLGLLSSECQPLGVWNFIPQHPEPWKPIHRRR